MLYCILFYRNGLSIIYFQKIKSHPQTFDLSCVSAETINLFLSASVDQEFSAQHSALGQSIRDEQANNKIY